MIDRPSTSTGRQTLGGATCRQHQLKLIEKVMFDSVAYVGLECSLCGHRNISTDGDPANVNRRMFDLFVGWKFHMIANIEYDRASEMSYWRLDDVYPRPSVRVGRGHLELAAFNTSLNNGRYTSASPNAERV